MHCENKPVTGIITLLFSHLLEVSRDQETTLSLVYRLNYLVQYKASDPLGGRVHFSHFSCFYFQVNLAMVDLNISS